MNQLYILLRLEFYKQLVKLPLSRKMIYRIARADYKSNSRETEDGFYLDINLFKLEDGRVKKENRVFNTRSPFLMLLKKQRLEKKDKVNKYYHVFGENRKERSYESEIKRLNKEFPSNYH